MRTTVNVVLPDIPFTPGIRDILSRLNDPLVATESAVSLPIECYTSQEWFEFERRAIWDREWVCLGHHSAIPNPGDYFSIDINGDPFLVVRGGNGAIHVMSGVCQHRGHLLGNDHGNVKRFVCPYHGWVYALDGMLIGAPEMEAYATVEELRKDHCLPILRSEIWNGFVFVNLNGRARPLALRLKALTKEIENYQLAALATTTPVDYPNNPWNWKWMQENGLEPYHTPVAHKGSHDVAPVHQAAFPEWDDEDDGAIYYKTRFIHIDGNFNETQKCLFPIMTTLSEEDRWHVLFGVIPPNLLITTLPDSAFYFITQPQGANSITLRVGFLFPESTLERSDFEETFKRAIDGFSAVNEEDIRANVSVHKGRGSRFANRGRIAPLEMPMVHLNHWFVTRYRAFIAEHEQRERAAAG